MPNAETAILLQRVCLNTVKYRKAMGKCPNHNP